MHPSIQKAYHELCIIMKRMSSNNHKENSQENMMILKLNSTDYNSQKEHSPGNLGKGTIALKQ